MAACFGRCDSVQCRYLDSKRLRHPYQRSPVTDQVVFGCMPKRIGSTTISRVLPLVTPPFHNMSPASKRSSSTSKPIIVKAERISPSPSLRSVSPEQKPAPSTDPRDIDYRRNPELYKILRGEMNVFKTQPYSDELKGLWRFKDEVTARRSSAELYEKFEGFR